MGVPSLIVPYFRVLGPQKSNRIWVSLLILEFRVKFMYDIFIEAEEVKIHGIQNTGYTIFKITS